MDGSFRANTLKLREHEDIIRQERRTAQQLCDLLNHARRLAPPEESQRYEQLIRQTERLVQYFRAMDGQVDLMTFELERLSDDISLMLADTGK